MRIILTDLIAHLSELCSFIAPLSNHDYCWRDIRAAIWHDGGGGIFQCPLKRNYGQWQFQGKYIGRGNCRRSSTSKRSSSSENRMSQRRMGHNLISDKSTTTETLYYCKVETLSERRINSDYILSHCQLCSFL